MTDESGTPEASEPDSTSSPQATPEPVPAPVQESELVSTTEPVVEASGPESPPATSPAPEPENHQGDASVVSSEEGAPPLPEPTPPSTPPPAPVSATVPISRSPREFLARALASIQSRKQKKLTKIVEHTKQKGSVTNDDVEKLLHVADATATRYLSQLVREGKLKRIGPQKRPRYEPV